MTEVCNDPSACHVCGLHAVSVGLEPVRRGEQPRYLCTECLLIVDRIKEVRRLDPYELKAREGGMDAAGPLIEQYGADLSAWTEDQVLIFCGTIWKGCADRLRSLIRNGEAPF